MFYLDQTDETKENSSGLKIKFDLIDERESQLELINFTTLVHFLDVYINNCHEKLFNVWNKISAKLIENWLNFLICYFICPHLLAVIKHVYYFL